MGEEIKDLATLLKRAIKSENDGFTFYDLLSKETSSEIVKSRLETLRDDERRHRGILIDLFNKHVGNEIGQLPQRGIGPLEKAFNQDKLIKFNGEIEYINLAIEAELSATKFYKENADAVNDPDFSKILNDLSDEENAHYEWLMAEREALAGNYFWFSSDGTSPMED